MENILELYGQSAKNPFSGTDYFMLSLKSEPQTSIIGIFTSWLDFSQKNARNEIRIIDEIDPEKAVNLVRQDLQEII
jgi:hypothetical protein